MKSVLSGLLALVFLAGTAAAEVKVRIRADGTKLLYNEGGFHRSSPGKDFLRPVPNDRIGSLIDHYADSQRLDPLLVQAVIQVESSYRVGARSKKGAMGLMQLMPGTARSLSVQDPFDPAQNIRGGTAYLRSMLDRFDARLEWALAAYNAGPGAVEKHHGVPPYDETRAYVRRVLRLYQGGVVPWENRGASTLEGSPPGRKVALRRAPGQELRMVTLPR